jgi:hypothetical protein
MQHGNVALDAGRGEMYVRDVETGREWLCSSEETAGAFEGRSLVVAEANLIERLATYEPVLYALHVADAAGVVMRCLKEGGSDVALIDANYVRGEGDLYRKPTDAAKDPGTRAQ